ncbi:HAUS6 protein, partial [Calyptomena viridis]|nr:HAUS6 protein [Calyptomena viridis]
GSKFVHMVYQFARHVMIEDMKKLSLGTGILLPKVQKLRPEDMHVVKARHRVANNKLLKILQKEVYVIREYGKKAR